MATLSDLCISDCTSLLKNKPLIQPLAVHFSQKERIVWPQGLKKRVYILKMSGSPSAQLAWMHCGLGGLLLLPFITFELECVGV